MTSENGAKHLPSKRKDGRPSQKIPHPQKSITYRNIAYKSHLIGDLQLSFACDSIVTKNPLSSAARRSGQLARNAYNHSVTEVAPDQINSIYQDALKLCYGCFPFLL